MTFQSALSIPLESLLIKSPLLIPRPHQSSRHVPVPSAFSEPRSTCPTWTPASGQVDKSENTPGKKQSLGNGADILHNSDPLRSQSGTATPKDAGTNKNSSRAFFPGPGLPGKPCFLHCAVLLVQTLQVIHAQCAIDFQKPRPYANTRAPAGNGSSAVNTNSKAATTDTGNLKAFLVTVASVLNVTSAFSRAFLTML